MINITLCDPDELEQITGLTHDQLWDVGFNLDDCDAVAIFDEDCLPLKYVKNEWCEEWKPADDLWGLYYDKKIERGLLDLLENWENYCVGAWYVPYKGKIYVIKHRA